MSDALLPSRRQALALSAAALGFSRFLRADSWDTAPRFSGKTVTGESFNNQSLLGKVVLVEFWATWCPYCKRDAGPLNRLTTEFAKEGLVVLAVNVGESKRTVKAFLADHPSRGEVVLMQDTNLAAVFEAKSYPLYVLIDREGKIAGEQRGSGGKAALRRLLHKAGLESAPGDDAPIELQSSPRRGA